MNRRAILTSATVLSSGLLAGCQSRLGFTEQGMRLGGVTLLNSDSSPKEFDIRIRRDGEVLHASTVTVAGEGYSDLGCEWKDTTGDFELAARVDSEEWSEQNLSEWVSDGDCASAIVNNRGGEIRISTGGNCEFGC